MSGKYICTILIAILVLGFVCKGGATSISKEDMPRILQEGNYLFMKANELAKEDPWQAKELYAKAASYFESLALEGGARNAKLYYNIGNAFFMSGDLGRAILYYKRALALDPNDVNLAQNIGFARSKRIDKIDQLESAQISRIIFFWHYDIPSGIRLVLFLVFFACIWVFLGCTLFLRRALFNWGIILSAVFAILFLVSLVTDAVSDANAKPGVIIQDEVTARKGDGDTYEPSFQEPLHSGTELRIVEARRGWDHIELVDGRQAWVPEKAVGLVQVAGQSQLK